jgi:hypothetical protein
MKPWMNGFAAERCGAKGANLQRMAAEARSPREAEAENIRKPWSGHRHSVMNTGFK